MESSLFDTTLARLRSAAGAAPACKICAAPSVLYDVVDFAKSCDAGPYPAGLAGVPVYYRRCTRCGFVFTDFFDDFDDASWRTFVYNDDYRRVDPGYAHDRPAANARLLDALLRGRRTAVIGLDYGGGSGATCEQLRALGYAFDTWDPFGGCSLTPARVGRYNFCSAFEVAEHSPDPAGFLQAIVALASPGRLAILVGTQLNDGAAGAATRLAWWYAAPRNGHVSLHSARSMQLLGQRFALDYTRLSDRTHLFTRGWSRREAWLFLVRGKLAARLGPVRTGIRSANRP
jgi:Methyltransferase domain